MKLRQAKLPDLNRIEQIHREAEARFSSVPPPARLWALVSQTFSAFLPLSQETVIYVAEVDGKVAGFVQASGRPATLVLPAKVGSLQVLNLCVAESADEGLVARGLIEYLCEQAGKFGAHRLFVRVPLDDMLLPIFRGQGFRQYATESVLYAERPQARSAEVPPGLRSVRGRDSRALYHLYRKVTPMGVAHLEAPSYKDWKSLRSDPGQQEVLERMEIVGWYRVQKSSQGRPHTLSFMALPEAGLADELADHAITTASGEPAWSSLRHYDSDMIDALRGRGFSLLLSQALLVREVTLTVPAEQRQLAPALNPAYG